MSSSITIYETEQGDPIAITGKQADGSTNSDLSWVTEADCTIEIKDIDDTVLLTLVGTTDFTLADPTFTWTPTDTHISALTKNTSYECFVHARNNATPRERILRFKLKILNS